MLTADDAERRGRELLGRGGAVGEMLAEWRKDGLSILRSIRVYLMWPGCRWARRRRRFTAVEHGAICCTSMIDCTTTSTRFPATVRNDFPAAGRQSVRVRPQRNQGRAFSAVPPRNEMSLEEHLRSLIASFEDGTISFGDFSHE